MYNMYIIEYKQNRILKLFLIIGDNSYYNIKNNRCN